MDSSKNKSLKNLNRIVKTSNLDIEFENLTYSVKDDVSGKKQILKSVNGKFCSGELTAILGPSGAGKSTLLNVLAGYISTDIEGDIKINNSSRDLSVFKKMLSYIMQDNITQTHLTVIESMTYAAKFKLGHNIKEENKRLIVEEVINFLGLNKCLHTRTELLSGGERKRLIIALELVSNPPIIFLDEPTTGLDYYAIKRCITLLKEVSKLDRTVICTIHQPLTSFFQYFDQVYVMANGYCVYNGTPTQMVPFLSQAGFPCPITHTPADYIIELVHSSPPTIQALQQTCENGKMNMKEQNGGRREERMGIKSDEVPLPFGEQFCLVLSRKVLQMKRNKAAQFLQIFPFLFLGLVVAVFFGNIGDDGYYASTLVKYCSGCNFIISYISLMMPIMLYPMEIKLLKMEYFNRWYSLKAYYCALMVASIPLLVFHVTLFVLPAYFLTDQPRVLSRFLGYFLVSASTSVASQAVGHFLGTIFCATKGSVLGPLTVGSMFAVSIHRLGSGDLPLPSWTIMNLDFIWTGFAGLSNALLYQREPMGCSDIYCFYSRAELILREVGVTPRSCVLDALQILVTFGVFRVLGYLVLKWRLKPEMAGWRRRVAWWKR